MPATNENKPPAAAILTDEGLAAIKAIRALVASLKETSTVLSVMRDYLAIEGEPLPYRKFGFNTVEAFLQASGEFVIKPSPGEPTRIYIKPNRDSAHIQNMVSAQKSSGKAGGTVAAKRSNFIALRQPAAPAMSGRGFTGTTQYSRMYQQMPNGGGGVGGSGRNNGSPKKVSFKSTPVPTEQQKGKGVPAAAVAAEQGKGGTMRMIKGSGKGSSTTGGGNNKQGSPAGRNASTSPEANNNSRAVKNYNLNEGGGEQQQQQLSSTDLRHWLNERNGTLSRSSVEMRQSNKALLPLSTTSAIAGRTVRVVGGSGIADARRMMQFSGEERTPSGGGQPRLLQIQITNARKSSPQSNETTPGGQQQQQQQQLLRNGNQSNGGNNSSNSNSSSSARSHSVGSGRMVFQPAMAAALPPPLPLMSIDVPPPTAAPMISKSVNSRLQLAKGGGSVAVAVPPAPTTPSTESPQTAPLLANNSNNSNNITFQRAQSLDERTTQNSSSASYNNVPRAARFSQPLVVVPPPPQQPAPLLGKKSLQDRLKINQQVAEKDLEVVAKLTSSLNPAKQQQQQQQQQKPAPLERTLSGTSTGSSSTASELVMSSFAPTQPPTSFSWSEPNATPVELLVKYSSYKGYVRPEYRYYRLKTGRIQCRVTINGSTYSTYPADFSNEFEGQFAAALAAIEAIQRDDSRQTYSVCLDADQDIAGEIHELLSSCPHGMFSKNIPEAFRAAHQALLPDHWFSIIDRYANELFLLEDGPGDTIVFAREQPSGSDAGSNTSEARQMAMNQLELPWAEQYWNLYITNPVSTVEVWARLVGEEYSDKMDALITDIEISMLSAQPKADEAGAAVGEYYLVSITDCWYRVRVDEINYVSNQCQCFFIDIGEKEQIALDQLYQCDPKYLQLPGQAKCFTLEGLEDFSENPKAKHHLDALLSGRVFVGEILTRREEYESAEQRDGVGSGALKLMLYDTSSEYDVLLNPIILKNICDDTPAPELNRKTVNYVSISHVDDQGDVYCQKDGTMKYIQKLITNLTQSNALEGEYRGLYKSKASAQQQLYLVQDETDGRWYRAALDAEESGPYCRMLYVDIGCRRRANVSNIYRLELLSLALSRYPPQAIRMRMFELPGCGEPQTLARLRAFLKPAVPAMAKVFAMASSTLPLVKVYVHVSDGGEAGNKILVCVNEAIKIEQELEIGSELISTPRIADITSGSETDSSTTITSLSSTTGGYSLSSVDGKDLIARFDGLNLNKLSESSNTTTKKPFGSGTTTSSNGGKPETIAKLAKMTVPPVGQLFDVKVMIASSPNYFIIQPHACSWQLDQLMCELQEFCMTKAQPVRKEQVRQGEAYAAFHRDGHWYRVVVVNIILFGPTPIHAHFCDFGQIEMLDVSNLRVLPTKFRVLPQQAVKAKLYGVKPRKKDWLTADAVRFQELTVGRKFASVVRSIQADEFDRNEELLELDLIDVSTEDDVYMRKVLVDEGRAVYTAEAHTV